MLGINATGRGENDLLDARRRGGSVYQSVKDHIRRAIDLVEVDITSAAMIGRVVEHIFYIPDRRARYFRVEKVALDELDRLGSQQTRNVFLHTAAEIVDNANSGPPRDQRICKM